MPSCYPSRSPASRRATSLPVALLVPLLAACPSRSKVPRATPRPRAHIEVFTEAGAVNDVAAFHGTLWVATGNGLVSWDLKRATADTLTVEDGLPGADVRALARGAGESLWVATTGGISRFQGGRWTHFGDCPLGTRITALAAGATGVYAGGPNGLARLVGERWSILLPKVRISGLFWSASEQVLWVATRDRGMFRCRQNRCLPSAARRLGQQVIHSLAGEKGRLVAILGGDRSRLAIRWKGRWHRYQTRPRRAIGWVHFAGDRLLLGGGGIAFSLRERQEPESPPGPLELVSETRGAPEFLSRRIQKQLPRHVTVVRRALGWLWLGSRHLGVARFNGDALQYFRTNDLTREAHRLSVDCPRGGPCLLCTGSRLFRESPSGWSTVPYPLEPEAKIQWIGRYRGQPVLVVVNGRGGIDVAIRSGATYKPLELRPPLRSKRGPLRAKFVRLGPGGLLWLGLALGRGEDTQGIGVASVNLHTGAVRIHGSGADLHTTAGAVRLPSEVTGVAFAAGSTYVATLRGVVRIRPDGVVQTYDENTGLVSELVQGIDLAPDGHIWVATPQGLGEYDGTQWHFEQDGPRATRVSAVRVAADGAVWFASDTGVHRLVKGTIRSWDDASGLFARDVRHLTLDEQGRVWLLHRSGLSLLTPLRTPR